MFLLIHYYFMMIDLSELFDFNRNRFRWIIIATLYQNMEHN